MKIMVVFSLWGNILMWVKPVDLHAELIRGVADDGTGCRNFIIMTSLPRGGQWNELHVTYVKNK